MKLFWAVVVGLVVAAGVLLSLRGGERPGGAATPTARTSVATGPEPRAFASAPGDSPAETSDGPAQPAEGSVGAADAPEAAREPVPEPAPEPAPEVLAETPAAGEPAPELEAPAPEPAAETPAEPATAEGEPGGGVLVLNDRYRVPGAGTASDPYKVDFETLVALEHEYEPKTEGKDQVPAWIKPLDGKHVEITGFIGFPFIAPSADECMVMLNQWDGCCIGVPPTPYDAVEVKLAAAVDLSKGVPNYGTIRGVFRTDPYLVNGWLIGLYVMDDATLSGAGSKNQVGY